MMTLADLLAEPHRRITGLTSDSRQVRKGFLFAALPGNRANGATYMADAVARGAAVILTGPETTPPEGCAVPVVRVDHPRRELARLAGAFYAPLPEVLTAVTGTNGKTSTAMFTLQLWQALGHKAATIGTNGIQGTGINREGSLTTPDPVALAADLADLHQRGISHVALEASSHGLDQFRLDGLIFKAGGFTYLGRDHLDYHVTAEQYFHAKSQLFARLLPRGATAVLNADVPELPALMALCVARGHTRITYGRTGQELRLLNVQPEPDGLQLDVAVFGKPYAVRLPLTGAFQAGNVLCALGLVIGAGTPAETAVAHLSALRGVRGRMELVGRTAQGAGIYVDYAHTPDALETVLAALRPHTRGKLHVVFGCGGNRDKGKRPQMGAIAARLADVVHVTDDNPRHEDPAVIRREVRAGCPQAFEHADRTKAVQAALDALQGGDTLVIAGKGHEQGQIIGDEVLPYDDAQVVRQTLTPGC